MLGLAGLVVLVAIAQLLGLDIDALAGGWGGRRSYCR